MSRRAATPGHLSPLTPKGIARLADQGRWFKLWASAVSDPDLRALSLEDFGRWCAFGVYLKLHGKNGRLEIRSPALPLQELLRLKSFQDVVSMLQSFPHCTAKSVTNSPVTLVVVWENWQRYQGDYSGDRVRKWRREHKRSSNAMVTPKEEKRSRREVEEKRREEQPLSQNLPVPVGPSLGSQAWDGYCAAYRQRYGESPVRNRKVNSLFKQFSELVPLGEAPHIAAFYVSSQNRLYVNAGHAVNLLIRDAEKLRTEWATGRRITDTQSRQADKTAALGQASRELIEEAERGQ